MGEQTIKNGQQRTCKLPSWMRVTIWIIVILFLTTALWVFRDIQVEKILDNRQDQISDVILKSLKHHVENDIVMPESYIITFDTVSQSKLNDSLINYLRNVLLEKYIHGDSTDINKIITSPYFIFPSQPNEDGNYLLTEKQLAELKQNIIYLTSQVDKAVSETKKEISRDLDRLNLWVTWWIGIIGFLGIFIPILLNYQTSKKIDKELDSSVQNAKDANEKIDKAEPTLQKVDDIENRVNSIETNVNQALKDLEKAKEDAGLAKDDMVEAKQKSETALSNSITVDKLLLLTNVIGKLKSIDASRLSGIKDRKGHLIRLLERIYESLKICDDNFNHSIIKDSFQELVKSLQTISIFGFIDHTAIDHITKYTILVDASFKGNWTLEKFIKGVEELKHLVDNLKE